MEEAEWDLETAEYLHKGGRFNAACFYAQQSAEKAARAQLHSANESPWGHSVRELLVRLVRYAEATGKSVDRLLTCARELDRHYVPSTRTHTRQGRHTKHTTKQPPRGQ
ncbi:MAG: HEPN domain-containing protein [Candidatus Freyarchaeota archaeon]